ncbi:MAG: OmpA family protein [Spirochaetales bacterium]|nr:OmpA family protein [Spirochaetales bacterium]
MKKKTFSVFPVYMVILAFVMPASASAQTIEELYSPYFLSVGINTASIESPVGDIINPAASGAKQRTTLDLSYIGLPQFDSGLMGHAGNLGITIPTKFGVFSTSGHFVTSPIGDPNLGTLGGLYASFSKDLFPDFLVGAGIGTQFGVQSDNWGFGVGLDLGILHLPGDLLFLKDFRWGIALRGLGLGYTPTDDVRLFPRAFTPSIGAYFKLIKTDNFSFALSPDISVPGAIPVFPGELNVRASLGGEMTLFDVLSLYGNLCYDFLEVEDTASDRPFYSFGAAVKFKLPVKEDIDFLGISDQGWGRSEIKANLVFVPISHGTYGIGGGFNIPLGVIDETPPEIKIETKKTMYVSPNHDGVQDDIDLPVSITDRRYVKGYRFVVTDEEGNVVREIENKEARPENVSFKNVMDRLFYVKQGIPIPDSIRWDARSNTGTIVEDGTYHYYLESWDDNNNTRKSDEGTVVIDKTTPSSEVATPYLIFSPNNDGNKDAIVIEQSGSVEDLWTGTVTDLNENEIATFSWENTEPQTFEWDGKNKEGVLVPDGVYRYRLTARDRAGNVREEKVDNIIINTEATPINITIGLSEFSPNDDGIKDTLRFNLDIPVTRGIESWKLDVRNREGKTVRTFSGTDEISGHIDFDGKDEGGKVLSETAYTGVLQLVYVNGNNPSAVSPEFTVDYTAPRATVNANEQVFSPNNDGNKDTIVFANETSEEIQWTGEIRGSSDEVVKKYGFRGRADLSVEWDGRGNDGRLAQDGRYSYFVYSTDKAGNYGTSNKVAFELNTEETPVLLSTDVTWFSPNADGSVDTITIIPQLKVKTDIERFTLTVRDEGNRTVRTITGTGKEPSEYKWNGRDESGKTLPDGRYTARLEVLYKNGNNPESETQPFHIDTVFPSIDIGTDYTLFSPDGDGRKDIISIRQTSSEEDLWEGEIRNKKNEVVRTYYWKGKTSPVEWYGRDDDGNKLEDGQYSYAIHSTDKAGNRTEKKIIGLLLDTRQTSVFLTVDGNGLSPDGDGNLDTIGFKAYVGLQEGIGEWKLELVHATGGVQKVFSGDKQVPSSFTWDGKKEKTLAPEGFYTAVLSVEYKKGNLPRSESARFRLDVSPPEVSLNALPEPFSPDNDGIDDELTIIIDVNDPGEIVRWEMEIFDPTNVHFISYQGKGKPSKKIIWNGLSDTGELVQSAEDYKAEFKVYDDLGNKALVTHTIPIDILVMKVGDRYKIRIPSITFKPYTPDYLDVEPERKERNLKTLNRLAEIFKKYAAYNIIIEGHAVSLEWANPEKAKIEQENDLLPLSKKRAEAIKNGLVELGIEAARISTVGVGGTEPVVPHGDLQNRWKNRRVEFILVKGK